MIYMRGQARDYDAWGAGDGHGANPGWSWAECLPAFLKHEDFYKGADAFHAAPGFDPSGKRAGGEWRVEKQRLHWPILDAFAAAAVEAGLPHTDDFNRGDNEGVGYFDVNQRAGIRWNATKAFLRPAFPRPNLQVWTGAHIHRVVFDGDGAPPASRSCRSAAARRSSATLAPGGEVVLAAGAIGSPQILQLSGIGDPALLASHGIAVDARAARRRREPAGPPADPRRLRRRGRQDAQHVGVVAGRQGADRARVRPAGGAAR